MTTREELLRRLGLTDKELRDFLSKFMAFYRSLNEPQKRVIERTLPTLEQAARSFGPDVTVQDIEALVGSEVPGGSSGCVIAVIGPSC